LLLTATSSLGEGLDRIPAGAVVELVTCHHCEVLEYCDCECQEVSFMFRLKTQFELQSKQKNLLKLVLPSRSSTGTE
jgi:hypothetical protein